MRSPGKHVIPPFIFSLLDMFKFQSVKSEKSLQLAGSMLGLTASLKIFKVRAYYGMTKCLIMSLRCGKHCEKKSSFYRKKNVSPTIDRT